MFFDKQGVACDWSQKYKFFTNSCMLPHTNSSFTILDAVDSTNNYAMAKVHAGLAKQGDAFFSPYQINGKGQRGKVWLSGQGQSIAISIVLEPHPLKIPQQFHLSAAVSLACFDFFRIYAGDETKIKWPNDIYWRDRKAGGILIENIIGNASGKKELAAADEKQTPKSIWKFAIAGIGININQTGFDTALKNPVSLKQITGKDFNITELAMELQKSVLQRVDEVLAQPFEKLLKQYNHCLYKLNQSLQLKKGNIIFETVVKGVNENGQLFTADRVDNFFDFGEIEWLL